MLRINGKQKRQDWLRLRVTRGQSPGLVVPICNTQFIHGAKLSDTYIHIHRKIMPVVRLGGLALLTNECMYMYIMYVCSIHICAL